jgi:hypothetical protein
MLAPGSVFTTEIMPSISSFGCCFAVQVQTSLYIHDQDKFALRIAEDACTGEYLSRLTHQSSTYYPSSQDILLSDILRSKIRGFIHQSTDTIALPTTAFPCRRHFSRLNDGTTRPMPSRHKGGKVAAKRTVYIRLWNIKFHVVP